MIDKFADFATSLGEIISRFIMTVETAAKDTLKMIATRFMPFLVMTSVLSAFVSETTIGTWLANALSPLAGSLPGLVLLAFIVSCPIISPILAPASAVAAVCGTLVGTMIAAGEVPVICALPALWACNAQVGADSIAIQMNYCGAESETIVAGVPAYLVCRWVTGPLAVVIAWFLSVGLY